MPTWGTVCGTVSFYALPYRYLGSALCELMFNGVFNPFSVNGVYMRPFTERLYEGLATVRLYAYIGLVRCRHGPQDLSHPARS
jgi:hypothetical protein